VGLSSDLHITAGDESDAIKRFGVIGAFFAALSLIQFVVAGLVLFASL
jgi:hypothetical protein